MKSLYININNEQIQSNEELEVLNYDLDSDFFFYLGEKIAKGCKVENENALITDFNTQDNEENYKQIIAQWNELKILLFSEECRGNFDFSLPNGYIHWLKFHPEYVSIYDENFSHGERTVISINLEELYEDSVKYVQQKILRVLNRKELYKAVDEIVFNDNAITRKSPIIREILDEYKVACFKTYKDYKKKKSHNDFFYLTEITGLNFVLGKTNLVELNSSIEVLNKENNSSFILELLSGFHLHFNRKGILSDIKLEKESQMPQQWFTKFGWSWNMDIQNWVKVLNQKNFIIYDYYNALDHIDNPYGKILVQSPNYIYRILIHFDEKGAKFISIDNMPDATPRKDITHTISFSKPKQELQKEVSRLETLCPTCQGELDSFMDGLGHQCKNCGRIWFLNRFMSCPHCHSNSYSVIYTDNGQYACTHCQEGWHRSNVECPICGSKNIEDDGTNYKQYSCNDCHNIFGDTDEESCPKCQSKNVFYTGYGYLCNNCEHKWE